MPLIYVVSAPYLLQKPAVGDHAASLADQRGEELVLRGREMHLRALTKDLATEQIDSEPSHGEDRLGRRIWKRGASERHADSGKQFGHSERLREIVVGSPI